MNNNLNQKQQVPRLEAVYVLLKENKASSSDGEAKEPAGVSDISAVVQ